MIYSFERVARITTELKQVLDRSMVERDEVCMDIWGSAPVARWSLLDGEASFQDMAAAPEAAWRPYGGELWGGREHHGWFRLDVAVPADFAGWPVKLRLMTGAEGGWDAVNPQLLIYDEQGHILQGGDVNHHDVPLLDRAQGGERLRLYLYAYGGMIDRKTALSGRILAWDALLEKVYFDLATPLEVCKYLDEQDKRRVDILTYLERAVDLMDLRRYNTPAFRASLEAASDYLDRAFYGDYCGKEAHEPTVTAVGATHIDVAWLWRYAQSREKVARSFGNALANMREYPEFIFQSSQPQLYQYLKEDYPELYEQVKARIAEGRFEAEGGMWLEADCNVTSGESLVRQFLFGTRFFEREFGVKNRILWLPDVFGYSAALPQIIKKSGIDYFMTTKINWNQFDQLPYDTFLWRGIDGTEVLTHCITATNMEALDKGQYFTTYNGYLSPNEVMGSWRRYQQKELNDDVLFAFGYGDGGGGPTREQIEYARRMNKGIPGCPRVRMGATVDYFERLDKRVSGDRRLPTWVGELYLEYHRGTYTSIAQVKKHNRKSELALRDVEALSAFAQRAGLAYPQERINRDWEAVLLHQFHDILPGSSIQEVYRDAKAAHERVLASAAEMADRARQALADQVSVPGVTVFNTLAFDRDDAIELPGTYDGAAYHLVDGQGNALPCQVTGEGKRLFWATGVPAMGYATYRIAPGEAPAQPGVRAEGGVLDNGRLRLTLAPDGTIASLVEIATGRQVFSGPANVITAYEDKPMTYDAWDIDIFYDRKSWPVDAVTDCRLIECGPVRAVVRVTKTFLESTVTQDVVLWRDIDRIDFVSDIDWRERQVLLKAAFPTDINADQATYEIQYGNVTRPTHKNTSWDWARFEVVGHKWADLSEEGLGVSLMNDCKYGHDIHDGCLRLTLLKSAVSPSHEADRERHRFTYAIYPHQGSWRQGGTVPMAYRLNAPLSACRAEGRGDWPAQRSFVRLEGDNAVLEVVKRAEDADALILRLYECHNRRGEVRLTLDAPIKRARLCNLMEQPGADLPVDGSRVTLPLGNYEIATVMVELG
ncbi:MAG: alpha-mannosidase [Christensenellales bacterium]|jgi:alpha-mannosidase